MQGDSVDRSDAQSGTTMMQVLGWLAAVGPAAVGLATISFSEVDRAPHVLQTDANAQGGSRAPSAAGETVPTPASGERDPRYSVRTAARTTTADPGD